MAVEASTDLATPTWSPVATNTLTDGWSYFSDGGLGRGRFIARGCGLLVVGTVDRVPATATLEPPAVPIQLLG